MLQDGSVRGIEIRVFCAMHFIKLRASLKISIWIYCAIYLTHADCNIALCVALAQTVLYTCHLQATVQLCIRDSPSGLSTP